MYCTVGYDLPEKVAIASRYLIPKIIHDSGIQVDVAYISVFIEMGFTALFMMMLYGSL